jgi:hypothetical protein
VTEIAPGMMVECITIGKNNGRRAFVDKIIGGHPCCCGKDHKGLLLFNWHSSHSTGAWAACCFKPIGGDKEIEQQESQRTGKSAKGDMRNGDDHPNKIRFFIIDMDDK